jgi:prevent-host-death family protein
MKTISIRELHERTGEWVRQAVRHEQIIVTDRGEPVAALSPYSAPGSRGNKFKQRRLLPGYARLRGKLSGGTDSTQVVSAGRDRA